MAIQLQGDNISTVSSDLTVGGDLVVNGVSTHANGVSVTGGSASSVTTGLVNSVNNLDLVHKGQDVVRLFDDGTTRCWTFGAPQDANIGFNVLSSPAVYNAGGNQTQNGASFRTDINNSATHITNLNSIANVSTSNNVQILKMFAGNGTTVTPASGNNFNQQMVFYAGREADTDKLVAVNNYGFYSSIFNSSIGKNNYNFYAAGNAPNYFRGDLKLGSDTLTTSGLPDTWTNNKNGAVLASHTLYISQANNSTESANLSLNRQNSSTGPFIKLSINGSFKDSIRADGGGGIIYGDGGSDYRLKENVVDLPSAVNTIKSLRPVNFNYLSHPGATRSGFIAHEFAEANIPFSVTGTKDATEPIGTITDYDGTELETNVVEPEDLTYEEQVEATPYVAAVEATYDEYGNELTAEVPAVEATYTTVTRTRTWTPTGTQPVYQGVDQTKLIPLLTKALQEALDRIDQLESNTLQPLYSTFADLPSATDHHGKVAHVHSEGALYFAHAGSWVKLQNA